MRKIILIVGASSSGKSELAEKMAVKINKIEKKRLFYMATMKSVDAECENKIQKHRLRREGTDFLTIEKQVNVGECANIFLDGDCVLLECVSNLLANEMYDVDGAGNLSVDNVVSGIKRIAERCNLVVVSNEVGLDGVDYDEYTKEYVKNLGTINQRIAQISDEVIEVVSGVPIYWKRNEK